MSIFSKGKAKLRAAFAAAALAGAAALAPVPANAGSLDSIPFFFFNQAAIAGASSSHRQYVQPRQQAAQPAYQQQYYYPYYYPQSHDDFFQGCRDESEGLNPVSGIGVVQAATDNGIAVRRIFEDGPAARAGVRPGDILKTIDGKAVTSVEQARKLIVGAAGTDIALSVIRDGAPEPVAFRFKREHLDHWKCTQQLYDAVESDDHVTARELAQYGAKPTTGMLDYAVNHSSWTMTRTLLEAGAKPTTGMLDRAVKHNDSIIAQELMRNGVKATTEMYGYAKQHDFSTTWNIKEYGHLSLRERFSYAIHHPDADEVMDFTPEILGVCAGALILATAGLSYAACVPRRGPERTRR